MEKAAPGCGNAVGKGEKYEECGVHSITRSQCLPGRGTPPSEEGRNEQARRQNTWEASQVVSGSP